MRVNSHNTANIQNSELGSARKADQTEKAKSRDVERAESAAVDTSGSANIELSARAREMAQAKAAASGASDVREAKIAELKRRIAAKQYNVKPEEIADKMVDEHVKTRHLS